MTESRNPPQAGPQSSVGCAMHHGPFFCRSADDGYFDYHAPAPLRYPVMQLSDFDYDLPEALIAQHPLARRSASRLLYCTPESLLDKSFADLPSLLSPGDLVVFNDTRVIKARLLGKKESGGAIEVLIERISDAHTAWAQVRASHAPLPQSTLMFDGFRAEVLRRDEGFFELHFHEPVAEVMETIGELPLPPYITHPPDECDRERYQTIFARYPGAVAAPTAGLHFDAALLEALAAQGIETATLTLHVGAGTFQPVRTEALDQHVMHAEHYDISSELTRKIDVARRRGRRVVAVGTTSLRALESAVDASGAMVAGSGVTRLFVTPGYQFRVVDALVTNFHLPKSTLLILVSAFSGVERIRRAYQHAIAQKYRFFSYGDAMLLER